MRLNRIDAAPTGWPALNLGILLHARGKLEEAETLFREALTYDRHFAPGYYQLGALLEERGDLKEAVKTLRQATSADASYPEPHCVVTHLPAAGSGRRSGRGAVHLQAAAQPESRSPGRSRCSEQLASPCTHCGARPRSVSRRITWRSVAASAGDPRGSANVAANRCSTRTRRFQWGQSPRRTGLESASRRSRAAQPAGVIAAQQGAFESAEAHFETAIRLAPTSAASCENLGRLYQERAGDNPAMRAKAIAVYRRLLTAEPGNAEGLFQGSFLLALDGQFATSRAMLAKLPEDVRQRPQSLAVLAADLTGMGDTAAARSRRRPCGPSRADRSRCPRRAPGLTIGSADAVAILMLDALDRRGLASPRALQAGDGLQPRVPVCRRASGAREGGGCRRRLGAAADGSCRNRSQTEGLSGGAWLPGARTIARAEQRHRPLSLAWSASRRTWSVKPTSR